jgi:hypothetical protein
MFKSEILLTKCKIYVAIINLLCWQYLYYFINNVVFMLILLLGTIKTEVRRYLESALLISRHQPYVSAQCTRWQLTQLLQPVKQNIPRGATLVLTVTGRLKFWLQDTSCTYYVTLRRFRKPLLQWKSNDYCKTRVCVLVVLGIQHAMRIRHIFFCGLFGCTIFFHLIS